MARREDGSKGGGVRLVKFFIAANIFMSAVVSGFAFVRGDGLAMYGWLMASAGWVVAANSARW